MKTQLKPTLTIEPHGRGLKRKMFNPDGGVDKVGRMDTICTCPCLCPADRQTGDNATGAVGGELDSTGAAGGESEVPDRPEIIKKNKK